MLAPGKHIVVETTYVTELQIIRGDVFVFTYKTAFDKQDDVTYFKGKDIFILLLIFLMESFY